MIPLPTDRRERDAIVKKYFQGEKWEEGYAMNSSELQRMSKYSGYSFESILNLPLGAYLLIKKDSWIDSMSQSQESRDVLKRIYTLQQKHADEVAIKRFNAKGGNS